MIAGEKIRRGEPEEEMIRLTQQGNIEAAMRQKKQVDLADLFLSHEHQTSELDMDTLIITPLQHRVILIEGVPGGGKSTLALHICHQWAQGASFLAKFDIVILAYLRDQAVQKAEDLLQILSVLHSNVLNFSRIINSIQASRVLFIFDGWDEFPPHLQQKSLVSTIIRQPDELDLPQSTVVITTRPVASGNLYHIADQRVEILGFTPHQIREYIEKALDNDSIPVQKLLQHLEEHPVIEEYCYVPLHAAILVHVFLTMKGVLPTTLHELFYKLVLCCIVREVETHHIKTDEIVTNFSSLLDLPDFLKSQLNDLSILAYKGVRQGKIVFSQSDLDAFQLSTKLPSLGLLVAVEGLTESGKSLSYNFLHLSIQQLLAAYHISQMDADEQVKVFQHMLQSSLLLPVLIHYSGFTKLDHPEVQGFISAYSQQLTHFQDILPLLHCFFAAQQPFVSQLVDQRFRCLELKTVLNPIDYLVVGFFINSLLSMSVSNNSSVTIKIRQIDDYRLNLLLFELSKYPIEGVPQVRVGHLPGRLILCLYDLNITGKMMTALFSRLGQLQAISEFSTCNIHHCEGELLDLTKALQSNPNLTNLVFRNTRLYTGDNGHAFIKLSQLNKSLTHLDLSMNEKFLDSDARRIIFQFLEHNTSLLHLNLSNTGITSMEIDTVNALEQMLKNNKSLNHLDLSKNVLLDSVAHKMFQALQCNTTLRCLNIGNTCITATEEDTIMALQLMLENNKSLTHLDLSENLFSDTAVCCIFECVKQNTTLVHLDMNSTGITATPATVQKLTQMLKQNKLKHLGLSNNILHSEAHCIFQTLQHNTALVYIDLCNTGITATHACALQTMLEKNKTLAYLNLSQNGLSDLGILFVSNGLRKNTTLVYLNLCQTGIKNEGAKYIARALAFNNSLQTLDISNNYIGDGIVEDDGFRHIERSLESNSMLRKLIISNRYYKYHISWYRASSINRSGIRQRKGLHPIDSVV